MSANHETVISNSNVIATATNENAGWQHVGGKSKNRRRRHHRARRTNAGVVDAVHPTLRRLQHLVESEFSTQKQTEYNRKFAPIMSDVVGKNHSLDPYLMEAMDTGSWRSIRKFDTAMVDALLHRSVDLGDKTV